jgi:16S rRNA (uracil1498-N3)-methyltransferase
LQEVLASFRNTETLRPITVVLFIGPEGGLMAEEVMLAQRHDVQVVTLGARILRAETAALTSVANVMYELNG